MYRVSLAEKMILNSRPLIFSVIELGRSSQCVSLQPEGASKEIVNDSVGSSTMVSFTTLAGRICNRLRTKKFGM
jgi:hypothetical protein